MATSPPTAEHGDSRAELRQLKLKSDQITDETLESTRRMLTICEVTKEQGLKIVVTLDDQGELLEHVEKDMDQINTDMREAQKVLRKMGRCCGLCCFSWKKKSHEEESLWKGNDDGKVANSQPQKMTDNRMGSTKHGGYIGRITNDAREDEMEENMGQVNNMIGNLRNMAIDIGSELENQNKQVDRIRTKGASNEALIADANESANKLFKP